MPSVETILLQFVCPAIGVAAMQATWIAPFEAITAATLHGNLGNLNPLPWVFMLATSLGWCVYSALVFNYWIFFGNIFGFILSVYYCLQAIKLQFHGHHSGHLKTSILEALETSSSSAMDHREDGGVLDYAQIIWGIASLNQPAPSAIEQYVLLAVVLWATVVTCIIFTPIPGSVAITIVGYLVVGNLILLFAAPLSTLLKIVKTRSSLSIHKPTMWTNLVKATVIFAYGLAIGDLFVALPNLAGLFLCVAQLVLLLVFRDAGTAQNKADGEPKTSDHDDGATGNESSQSSSNNYLDSLGPIMELPRVADETISNQVHDTGGDEDIAVSLSRLPSRRTMMMMTPWQSMRSVASDLLPRDYVVHTSGSNRLIFPPVVDRELGRSQSLRLATRDNPSSHRGASGPGTMTKATSVRF